MDNKYYYNTPEQQGAPYPTGNQPQYDTQQAPSYQQPAGIPNASTEVAATVNSAFGKALAATIMAWFPVMSIIAIFLGKNGLSKLKQANELAARLGVPAGGKAVATKILGLIGLIAGIVYTVIYSIYFLYFVAIVGMIGSMY